jgi:hypothetical protein
MQTLVDGIPHHPPGNHPGSLCVSSHIRIPDHYRPRPKHLSCIGDMALAIPNDLIGRPEQLCRTCVVIRGKERRGDGSTGKHGEEESEGGHPVLRSVMGMNG